MEKRKHRSSNHLIFSSLTQRKMKHRLKLDEVPIERYKGNE